MAAVPEVKYVAKVYGLSVICRLDRNVSAWTLYYPIHSKLGARIGNSAVDNALTILTNFMRTQAGLAATFAINTVGL